MLEILPKEDNQPDLPAVEHGIPPVLQPLIAAYTDLFKEPTTLPPSRGPFDHKIPLKEGTSSINLRPYRYSLRHKDIIEDLVREMLERGVI